jgi:hypothetical protein
MSPHGRALKALPLPIPPRAEARSTHESIR